MRTANRELMREWNTKVMLNLIRERKAISQVEISKKTGLSAGTVANITGELRKRGFIKNVAQGKSHGGRRPITFCFNSKAMYVISVALLGAETEIAILDMDGNIQEKVSYPTRHERGEEVVFKNLTRQAKLLLSQLSIPKDKVIALCVSVEGIVDADTGSLLFSSHFGWRDVPVKSILGKLLSLRTFVEEDKRAMALGEYCFGIGKKASNMVCIDIGAGIGAGLISNGQIHHGIHQMEGEIGHTLVLPDGPLCQCGKRGCLELVASGSAILRRARESLKKGEKTSISKRTIQLPDREAIRIIFQAAEKGDSLASMILQDAGHYLGLAIAAVVNYADPELVVLTGYVAEEDPGVLLKILRNIYEKEVFGKELRKVKIVKGKLGEDAVLVGAASLAYQDMFSLPH